MSKFKIGCVVAVLVVIACIVSQGIKTEVAVMTTSMVEDPIIVATPTPAPTITPAPTPEPEPSVPATVIYNVPLSEKLQLFTYERCQENLVDNYYPLMIAVMWHESNFDALAVSKTNDYGLMQINICNHEWLQEKLGLTDFLDAEQSIQAGVYILARYLLKYEDVDKALMAYNMGENGAAKCWKKGIYETAYTRAVHEKLELVLTSELQE